MCVFQLPAESQVNNNTTPNSLTEEQKSEAETLKNKGKDEEAALRQSSVADDDF